MNRFLLGQEGFHLSDDDYARAVAELGASGWHSRSRAFGPQHDVSWLPGNFEIRKRSWDRSTIVAAWRKRVDGWSRRIRIRIGGHDRYDVKELVSVLGGVGAESVLVDLAAPSADPSWQWPLRIAAFDDDYAALGLGDLAQQWPASKLAIIRPLSRTNARSEILVVEGDLRGIAARVFALKYRVRCGLLVMVGPHDREWRDTRLLVDALLAETQAYGVAIMSAPAGGVVSMLNRVCTEISHNRPIDKAIWTATDPSRSLLALDLRIVDVAALPEVALRIAQRLQRLPESAPLELRAETRGRLNMLPMAMSAALPVGASLGRALESAARLGAIPFDHEHAGGQGLAEAAVAEQDVNREVARDEGPRYLQGNVFHLAEGARVVEKHGLVRGQGYQLDVMIAPPGAAELQADVKLDEDQIDWQRFEEVSLQVLFAEPQQWAEPMRGTILLRKSGQSTTCSFDFVPTSLGAFAARVTLYYRGRVLQTAVLSARVLERGEAPYLPPADSMTFKVEAEVRRSMSTLSERRRFDAFLLCNHDAKRARAITAAAKDGAYVATAAGLDEPLSKISDLLTVVARNTKRYSKGLTTQDNAELLCRLATEGNVLYRTVVLDYVDRSASARQIRDAEYLQIVTMEPDALIPLEFVYEYKPPKTGAGVCKNAKKALAAGACPNTCRPTSGPAEHVCPMGFWGLQKVIERHVHVPNLKGAALLRRREPLIGRDTLSLSGATLSGVSAEVPERDRIELEKALKRHRGKGVATVTTWEDWREKVAETKPRLLVVLPHADGTGADITLEIGGKTIESRFIDDAYVRAAKGDPPITLLLGCDTANVARTDSYLRHIGVFRQADAAMVLGTVATVLGEDAANVAGRLVKKLVETAKKKPSTFGEALRATKRAAISDSLMMALCLVAFGDADWNLTA